MNVGDRYMYNAHTQRVCKGIQLLPTAANGRTDTLRVLGVSWVRLSAVSSFPLVGAAAAQQHTQRRPCRGDGQFERPNKQLENPIQTAKQEKEELTYYTCEYR